MASDVQDREPTFTTYTINWNAANVPVKTQFTEVHLHMVRAMAGCLQFWRELFVNHSLMTCDIDGRRCNCKKFFNLAVWKRDYEPLADDVLRWLSLLESFALDPVFENLPDNSEHFWDLKHTVDQRNTALITWQAHHADNDEDFVVSQLCPSCFNSSDDLHVHAHRTFHGVEESIFR